jgi:hypothetical protein
VADETLISIADETGEIIIQFARRGAFTLPDKETEVRIMDGDRTVIGNVLEVSWVYETTENGVEESVFVALYDTHTQKNNHPNLEEFARECLFEAEERLGPEASQEDIEAFAVRIMEIRNRNSE